jgi:hypothetical protein
MIISINQPAYLPWLGYINRIAKADLHIVLDHVQFEKNSFINRNKIRTKEGPLMLTIPLKTKGKFGSLAINQIEIVDNLWKKKHFKNIEYTYSKSPYYKKYRSDILSFFDNNYEKLIDIIKPMNSWLLNELKIKTKIEYSSNLNISTHKSDLILDICKKTKASIYLSGPNGRDYLNLKSFEEQNIKVVYDDYLHPVYKQFNGDFEPYMTTFDLLFNYGDESHLFLENKIN